MISPSSIGDFHSINTWQQFEEIVRSQGCRLLQRLDEFPNSVLVTGCQRSGTTMLARIITQSEGMVNYWTGPDDELDAALILSGYRPHEPRGRYCFQTTYVDECYHEYLQYTAGHKIVWVLRNPFSTIYSLVYNWPTNALHRTFRRCGVTRLNWLKRLQYRLVGNRTLSDLERACYVYEAKISHLLYLHSRLPQNQILVVDYDELVLRKSQILPMIYRFLQLDFHSDYLAKIHTGSVSKASALSAKDTQLIMRKAEPIYLRAKKLVESESTTELD